ncbi:S8 family serine peptidase [Flavobacterium branchiophilum]|uniref:S8 family serine peptidase n=1 Tax=Flavobacterium branchiophilum TaxID=55197 RepID=UPI0002DB65A0|nr:S8 family serine peptidase [Flavobacterium branchiophilum]
MGVVVKKVKQCIGSIWLVAILFFIIEKGMAQEDARVYFADKPNASVYLSNPLLMLSQRALDRRLAQNIPLSVQDVPLYQPYWDTIANANGIVIKTSSKWMNCVHVRGSVSQINALANLSFVSHIEFANPTLNSKTSQLQPPFAIQKTFEITSDLPYGNSLNQIQMLSGQSLHQQNKTGFGKIIAVLDAGFPGVDTLPAFQYLQYHGLILGGYNFVDQNPLFYSGNSHGTSVLSCMGGYVSEQLVGTAPDASYYLYVTEDTASENPVEESYWVAAAEAADRVGADVITSSLGYFIYDNPSYSYAYSDMTGNKAFASKGANIAFTKGIIVVVSAGNSGQSAHPHIGVPADATHALAVGAVAANQEYANFSSIGPSFDQRIKPDLMAQGVNAVIANLQGSIVGGNGTSFACPIMAGLLACFWQAYPALTNQQVVDYIKQSADRYNSPNAQCGYGIPNFLLASNQANLSEKESKNTKSLVYYNVENQNLNVQLFGNLTKDQIVLFDVQGRLVKVLNLEQNYNQFDISDLQSGVYMYVVKNQYAFHYGKFAK